MGIFTYNLFDDLIEKATSEFIPAAEEDLALNMEITDLIKSKQVGPKEAMRTLKRRLQHQNPNVQLLTLQLLDKCVKNGGKHFVVEVASREFVDELVKIMEDHNEEYSRVIKDRLMELFQTWSLLLQSESQLSYIYDTYQALKQEGRVRFPPPATHLDQVNPFAIVNTLAPPEWTDSPDCSRCRTIFTLTNRKHHCRKCGGCFCQLCSMREMSLPQLGLIEGVRVCENCWLEGQDRRGVEVRRDIQSLVVEGNSVQGEGYADGEDELQKALRLSLEEAERDRRRRESIGTGEDEDEMLKRAIEASLIESNRNNSLTMNTEPTIKSPTTILFNPVELENIQLFHKVMLRLSSNFKVIPMEDVNDLRNLSSEMELLRSRIYAYLRQDSSAAVAAGSLNLKRVLGELEEALKIYDRMSQNVPGRIETVLESVTASPQKPVNSGIKEGSVYSNVDESMLRKPTSPDNYMIQQGPRIEQHQQEQQTFQSLPVVPYQQQQQMIQQSTINNQTAIDLNRLRKSFDGISQQQPVYNSPPVSQMEAIQLREQIYNNTVRNNNDNNNNNNSLYQVPKQIQTQPQPQYYQQPETLVMSNSAYYRDERNQPMMPMYQQQPQAMPHNLQYANQFVGQVQGHPVAYPLDQSRSVEMISKQSSLSKKKDKSGKHKSEKSKSKSKSKKSEDSGTESDSESEEERKKEKKSSKPNKSEKKEKHQRKVKVKKAAESESEVESTTDEESSSSSDESDQAKSKSKSPKKSSKEKSGKSSSKAVKSKSKSSVTKSHSASEEVCLIDL